jgi:hypothetical protein
LLPDQQQESATAPAVPTAPTAPAVQGEGTDARNIFEATVAVDEQWDTTKQVEIKTTEAALRNILNRHLDALTAKNTWVPPLTLVVPIGVALLAGIQSYSAEVFLLICLGAALLWLLTTAKNALKYRGHQGIDAVIDDLHPGRRPTPAWEPGVFERLWTWLFGGPSQ